MSLSLFNSGRAFDTETSTEVGTYKTRKQELDQESDPRKKESFFCFS